MKKSLIALAVLAASGAAMAQSSVTLYGIADLAVVKAKGSSAALASGGVSTSRWGLKGSEDLGGGLAANFNFEQSVNLVDGTTGNGFNRQAWVGFSGGFGEIKLGKMWNAYDDIVGATSPLFDSGALTTNNLAPSYALEAGNPGNAVYYATPSFGGVSGAVSTTFKTGETNARVSAFHVKYEGGPVYAGLGYQIDKVGTAVAPHFHLDARRQGIGDGDADDGLGRVAERLQAAVDLLQCGHQVAAQQLARLGQRHLLVAAVEQHHAQFFLELADLVRQRGLRDVQPLGRAGEVERARQGDEVTQVPQFHGVELGNDRWCRWYP